MLRQQDMWNICHIFGVHLITQQVFIDYLPCQATVLGTALGTQKRVTVLFSLTALQSSVEKIDKNQLTETKRKNDRLWQMLLRNK